jgi:hypothetical protein
MSVQYVYPRLPRSVARRLLEDLAGMDLAAARAAASTTHAAAAPVATGPPPVPSGVVDRLAAEVRALADDLGYPAPLPRAGVSRFDQPCGDLLLEEMRITPADAASEEVWSFITLVVLPDIALWRFPDLLPERFLGLPRNTFRRVWWRSFTLQGENLILSGGPEPLGEDELVNIFERSSLSRSATVARAMTRAVRGLDGERVSRTAAMRELAKRLRRLVSFMALDLMAADDLDHLVSTQLSEAVEALRSVGASG